MKQLSMIFSVLILSGCQSDTNSRSNNGSTRNITKIECSENYDSLLLIYAQSFKATEIPLDKNLSHEVTSFILKTDSGCLEKQKEYKTFIAIILGKLYLRHLQCCNQGYDLLSMRNGAASVIINDFEKLAGYKGQNLEMLNSGIIADYIDREPTIKANKLIQEIRENIDKEAKRIKKGI